MYARGGVEKMALQSLGVPEARKEELRAEGNGRIVNNLIAGGFAQHAQRIHAIIRLGVSMRQRHLMWLFQHL